MEAQEKYKQELLKLGFKIKWLDDKSGWWLEKKLTHAIIKGVKVAVDGNYIFISCMEFEPVTKKYKYLTDIYGEKFNMIRLNQVLKSFSS